MFNLDRKWLGVRLRAWGLAANFLANTVFLIGLSRATRSEGGAILIVIGAIATIAIMAVLAVPDLKEENQG